MALARNWLAECLYRDGAALRCRCFAAQGFWARARGLLGRALPPATLWRFPACRAVHTLGMRRAIDVVFCDQRGRILKVQQALRPWRIAAASGACTVFELLAGEAARLGFAPGQRLQWQGLNGAAHERRDTRRAPEALPSGRRRQAGASLVEFALVLLLGVLPLALGVLQATLLLSASHQLQLASFMAARAAANASGDRTLMRRELARGLAALHVPAQTDGVVTGGVLLRAYGEALQRQAMLGSLQVLRPARADFDAHGLDRGGRRVIPNDSIEHRPLAVQQANVLEIGVTHCHALQVPLIDALLLGLLRQMDADLGAQRCYASGGLPLAARVSVPMQSDARLDLLY